MLQRFDPLNNCGSCPIRHRAVCSGCESDELAELEPLKSYKEYKKGETIVWADEPLTHLGSIVTGVAALNRTMEDGRCQIVGLLLPSDFIGRPGRASVAYNVVAATDLRLCRFEKPVFEKFLDRSPTILRRLFAMTSNDLDAARDWMLLLGRKTAREKVAGFLSMLVRRSLPEDDINPDRSAMVSLPLSRAELADYIGLTIETTSRQFSQLKRDGIISLPSQREVLIPSFGRLINEAGDS